jgi:hypothetical protein
MAHRSKIYRPEPKTWLCCPFRDHGCYQKFRNQSGRTKHIRSKHNLEKNELQTRTQSSSFDTSLPIDSDHQDSDTAPEVPRTPHPSHDVQVTSNGTDMNQSPDDPLSPPPFYPSSPPPFQPEVEIHNDQAEEAPTLSTNYHPLINGTT